MHIRALALAAFLVASLAAAGAPEKPRSPLDKLQLIEGAVEARVEGNSLYLIPGGRSMGQALLFKVDLAGREELPASFRSASARIYYWRGHLILVASDQQKAWSFTVPDLPPVAGTRAVDTPEAAVLEDSLRQQYDLGSISVEAISSMEGPRARLPIAQKLTSAALGVQIPIDYPDDGGGGVGSCGTTCSITCADGSNCSTTCSSRRCASCTCPATCSCK